MDKQTEKELLDVGHVIKATQTSILQIITALRNAVGAMEIAMERIRDAVEEGQRKSEHQGEGNKE